MRHFLWICAIVWMASCSREVRLTVVNEGLASDTLFAEYGNFAERVAARDDQSAYHKQFDTLLFIDGRLDWVLPAKGAQYVSLISPDYRSSEAGHVFMHPAGRIDLLVQSGEQMTVSLKPQKHGHLAATVSGSELNEQIVRLDNQVRSVQVDMYATGFALNEAIAAKSDVVDSLRNRMMNVRTAQHSVYADYMKQNPASEVSAYCFYQMGPKRGERYYRQLDAKVFKGAFRPVRELAEQYYDEQRLRSELKSKIEEGGEAPDFSLKDAEGKSVTLSSHRGKWVVLDFWGTWCSWCIKGMPRMKQLYETYAERIEIIGVACGDQADTWRTAVEKMRLEWVNVIDPMEAPIEESVAARFGVEGYPTKIIIDPDGHIHKIFKGESKEFYDAVKALFEEQK